MASFPVTHVEWDTTDHVKLKDFLAGVFGWRFEPFGPGYFIYSPKSPGVSVGLNQNEKAQAGTGSPNVYIDVASIDASIEKARELGGGVAVPKTALPFGAYAFIKAPDGNLIGLFETNQPQPEAAAAKARPKPKARPKAEAKKPVAGKPAGKAKRRR